jgi:hypothetical protein
MISMEKSRLSETETANIKIKDQNNGYLFSVLFVMNALYQNQSAKYFTFKLHTFYVSAFVDNWQRSGDFIIVFWDVWLCDVVDSNRSLSGTCCLHLEEAGGSSKTSEVIQWTTGSHPRRQ